MNSEAITKLVIIVVTLLLGMVMSLQILTEGYNVISNTYKYMLMGGLIVFGLDGFTPTLIWGAPLVSWVAGGLGAFILLVSLQD